jgi:hypothetical protein
MRRTYAVPIYEHYYQEWGGFIACMVGAQWLSLSLYISNNIKNKLGNNQLITAEADKGISTVLMHR